MNWVLQKFMKNADFQQKNAGLSSFFYLWSGFFFFMGFHSPSVYKSITTLLKVYQVFIYIYDGFSFGSLHSIVYIRIQTQPGQSISKNSRRT